MNEARCTAEHPDFPGLVCHLVAHGKDVQHYAMGYSWPDPVNPVRRAVVSGATASTVARYLPGNYRVVCTTDGGQNVLIEGRDNAGWTLDGYVIPRLASGLIGCRELGEDEDPDAEPSGQYAGDGVIADND